MFHDSRYTLQPMTKPIDWEELKNALDDELVRAVAAAFALVATADRDLAESEIDRFMQVVKEDPALARATDLGLENAFRKLAQGVLDDPEQGWFVCLAVLWVVKTSFIGILFPFFVAMLVPIRMYLKKVFRPHHLALLDAEEGPADEEFKEIGA